ncbi:MAG: M12 family metallo-peptidase [bacterium]
MKKTSYVAAMALVALALDVATPALARRTDAPSPGVPSSITHYESVAMMSAAAASGTGGDKGPLVELAFQTLGRDFAMQLEPSDVYAQGATIVWVDDSGSVVEPAEAAGRFYKGRLQNEPTSWVRLRISDAGELAGVVATADEVYFLEPSSRYFGAATAGQTVAYRLSDTDSELGPESCAAHDLPSFRRSGGGNDKPGKQGPTAHQLFARAALNAVAEAAGAIKRADIAVVADYEYFQKHGANSAADIAEVMNSVDGVYQSEVGVAMQILTTVVYSVPADPFSDTTDYNALLTEFSVFHHANDNAVGQLLYGADLAHLVTGRDLNGSVIGLAWIDGLCDSYYGSGISQDFSPTLYNMTLLLAHEMGHNFNAPHDGQSGSACSAAPQTFIMSPSLSSALQQTFSDCSKGLMNPAIASASCFDLFNPGPTNTPTNTVPPTNTATRTFTITQTPTRTGTPTRTPTRTSTPAIGLPGITMPGAGQSVGVEGVTFTWNPVASATGYDLRVVNTAGQVVFSGSLAGGNSTTTIIGLPNNGSYTFRARACIGGVISDATCGAFSSRAFAVSLIGPAGAPIITAPINGAAQTSSGINLAWTEVAGNPNLNELFYEVTITDRNTGLTQLQMRTFSPTTQLQDSLHSGSFRFVVRGCQADCGPPSAPVDFTINLGDVPSTAPTLNSPTVSGGNSMSAAWNAVSGSEWYQIQVVQGASGPGGGPLTVAARLVAGTNVTLPVPSGQASVIVAACNGDGCGPYSNAKTINPAGPNPSLPQIGVPISDSVVTGPSVLFAWSRIPGDNGSNVVYRLYVQDLSRQRTALDVLTTQNYYGALLKADGAKYAVAIIANPDSQSPMQSPAINFTVRGFSAVAPTLTAPTHGSLQPAGNVLVAWTQVPGAILYEYFVAVQGQPNAVGRGVTPGNFVQVPLQAVNGQPTLYSGVVRACPAGNTCVGGSDTGWGPWSSVAGSGTVSFTVMP